MTLIDTQIKWVTPLRKPWDGTFNNEAERGAAQFFDVCGIEWEYEPHFWIDPSSNLPKGHNDKGTCPDFYLNQYDCYVEVHGAEQWDSKQRALGRKRRWIWWLSARTGKPVILFHYHCWPVDLEDFHRLRRRAEIAATLEYADPLRTKYCS